MPSLARPVRCMTSVLSQAVLVSLGALGLGGCGSDPESGGTTPGVPASSAGGASTDPMAVAPMGGGTSAPASTPPATNSESGLGGSTPLAAAGRALARHRRPTPTRSPSKAPTSHS